MKTIETSTELLTISQEFASLISRISQKEIDFFLDDDIEILHEFRVDLRKLRTWSQILKKAKYPIQKIQKHLARCHCMGGDLRNIDVLISWAQNNESFIAPSSLKTFKRKRKNLHKYFIKELVKTETISKLRTLGRDFLPNIAKISKYDFEIHVNHYIEAQRKSITELLPQAIDDLEKLHEVRKMLKKVRYAFLLLPTIEINSLANLKELQEILGYINDRCVWISLIKTVLRDQQEVDRLEKLFLYNINDKLTEFKAYIASGKIF